MRVGVPREIKNAERRVGLTPASVRELVAHGHEVVVERHAGVGIGASDADYAAAGATLHNTAAEVFTEGERMAMPCFLASSRNSLSLSVLPMSSVIVAA